MSPVSLQLFVEIPRRARNKHAARNIALTIFDPLHDARRLAALRAIRAFGGVHDLLAVCSFCDFRHCFLLKEFVRTDIFRGLANYGLMRRATREGRSGKARPTPAAAGTCLKLTPQ